jgi:hypothetical protein
MHKNIEREEGDKTQNVLQREGMEEDKNEQRGERKGGRIGQKYTRLRK